MAMLGLRQEQRQHARQFPPRGMDFASICRRFSICIRIPIPIVGVIASQRVAFGYLRTLAATFRRDMILNNKIKRDAFSARHDTREIAD
jgi:hypothetical protein